MAGSDPAPVRSFAALGHHFAVLSPDPALVTLTATSLRGLSCDRAPSSCYTHRVDDGGHTLWRDGVLVGRPNPPGLVMPTLLWDVNRQVVRAAGHRVLVHAGVVAHGSAAVVMTGPSGAGKTTLTLALVRSGFTYLSDEMAAIDPITGAVEPFRRPLSLKPGSWPLFPDLTPRDLTAAPYLSHQWQIPAPIDGSGNDTRGALPRLILDVRHDPASGTALHALTRGEAVMALASNLLTFARHRHRDVATLAAVVRGADCYRLSVGRLDDAVALLIDELLGSELSA